jgi:hypothetical protein
MSESGPRARAPAALPRAATVRPGPAARTHSRALRLRPPQTGLGAGGTLILTPLQLLDRLAALVPPPYLQRHRYFDVPVSSDS